MKKPFVFLLLALSVVPSLGQDTPAVVLLRDTEAGFGDDAFHDQAVLLNRNCGVLKVIENLGLSESVSHQSRVLINDDNGRIYIVELLRDTISCFDLKGTKLSELKLEAPNAIVFSSDGKQLACSVGNNLNRLQTVIFDLDSGKQVRRLSIGGLAFVNDQEDELVWAIGNQITAFRFDGYVHLRRPLSQLEPEEKYPTVINARNWAATGVAFMYNSSPWARSFWVLERDHPNVRGSKNRLFAVDPDGRIGILTELDEIDPMSIAIPPREDVHSVLVVDRKSGDVAEYNSDGEFRRRHALDARLIAASEKYGVWIANETSIRRLHPRTLKVISQHDFENEAEPIGLTVR